MADTPKKKRKLRAAPATVREKAQTEADKPAKKRRIRRAAGVAAKPIKAVHRVGKKEYYLPMPKNRFGRFLNKRRYFIPKYFRSSWKELKEVTWPNRKQTTQLTIAVFIFAIVFGLLVAITDYGLDKIFKRILVK